MKIRVIDKLLKEENLLLESGIKMPKNTKAAKIFFHSDLDGWFSGLLTYNQLIKQGIKPQNIKLEMIQYGDPQDTGTTDRRIADTKKELEGATDSKKIAELKNKIKRLTKAREGEVPSTILDKMKASKGQMVAMVDFANIPEGARTPDFWSDHHISKEEWEKKAKESKGGKIGATDYPSDTEHIATVYAPGLADYSTIKNVSRVDSANFTNLIDTFDYSKDFKSKGRMERLAIIDNILLETLIKKHPNAVKAMLRETKPSLVHLYNNLKKYAKLTDLQNKGIAEFAKESPDWKLIDEIRSKMPSMAMKKEVAKGGKEKELKTIEQWREKNLKDLERMKTGYFEPAWKKELERIEKEYEDLEKSKANMIGDAAKEVDKKLEELKTRIEKAKGMKETMKGTLVAKTGGKVMKQDTTALRNTTARYLNSLVSAKGVRAPFVMRRFPTMIQIALNPDVDKSKVENVDLFQDVNDILQEIRKKFGNKYNQWAFDIIQKESGGHKKIANISALGVLGLMPKKDREEYKDLKELEDRAKAFKARGKSMKENMPKAYARLETLKQKREMASEKRKQIMDEIENMFYYIVGQKYGKAEVTKKTPKEYSIKEEILKELDNWR